MKKILIPIVALLLLFNLYVLYNKTSLPFHQKDKSDLIETHEAAHLNDDIYTYEDVYAEEIATEEDKNEVKYSIFVDKEIEPFIIEFRKDAKEHGYNIHRLFELDEIIIEDLDEHSLNGYQSSDYIVMSRTLYENDPIGFKFVLYHEIGHWFGKEHGMGIMRKQYNSGYDEDWVEENWEYLKQNYFTEADNRY